MTETGVIREVKGNTAIVAHDASSVCFGCMNHECRNAKLFFAADNPKALPLKIGQTVEVKASAVFAPGQALAAFAVPVLSFIAGYILTGFIFPKAGEGAHAGAGVIFLFTAAFIVYRVRKKRPAKEFPRYIERVLEQDESFAQKCHETV
jgi:sigma-E factor negative regulatory protein RseC